MTIYHIWTSPYPTALMYPIYSSHAIRQKTLISYALEGAELPVTQIGDICRDQLPCQSSGSNESSAFWAVSVLRYNACPYRHVPAALRPGPSLKPLMWSHQTFLLEVYKKVSREEHHFCLAPDLKAECFALSCAHSPTPAPSGCRCHHRPGGVLPTKPAMGAGGWAASWGGWVQYQPRPGSRQPLSHSRT